MALETQVVPVSLGQGVDTKTDPKQVIVGKLTALLNGIFQTTREIRKRLGFVGLPKTIQGGGSVSNGVGVSAYNNELALLDGSGLYSFSSGTSQWVKKGSLPTINLSVSTVIRTTTQQTAPDMAINGSYQCFTWKDAVSGLQYSVVDTATGQSLVNAQAVSSTGSTCKVIAIGTKFVLFYTDTGTTLKYKSIDTSTPTTLSSSTTIASDLNATALFDASILGSNIGIAYDNAASGITLYTLSSTLSLSGSTVVTTDFGLQCLTIFSDAGSSRYWISFANSSNVVKYFVRSSALASFLAVTTIETASLVTRNITGAANSGSGSVYYELIGSISSNQLVRTASLTDAGVTSGIGDFLRSVGLASKAVIFNSVNYLLLTFGSTLQSTYFLVNGSGLVVGKLAPGVGGGLTANSILPELVSSSGGVYFVASLIKDLLTAVSGSVYTQTGVQSAQFSFSSAAPPKFVLGDNLHVGGAITRMYDGSNVVEHGFNLFPEGLTTTLVTGTGGIGLGNSALSINSFQHCAVYEWTDNQGQIHRSAPSIPVTTQIPATIVNKIVGDTNSTGGPPTWHGTQIINVTGASAYDPSTSPTGIWYVNIIGNSSSGASAPFLLWTYNGLISSATGTTITLGFTYGVAPASGLKFIVSSYPLSWFSGPGVLVTKGVTPVVGQVLVPADGTTSYPANTQVASVGVAGAVTLNNLPLGTLGTAVNYYAIDTFSFTVTAPTLRLTSKNNVSIALYRTQNDEDIFYRTSSPTTLTYNNKTVDSVTFTDVNSDNAIVGNEQLYTTGGEIENIPAPAISAATTYKSRAIVLPSEAPLSWWYAKQVIPGSPVEFSDAFVNNIDSDIVKASAVQRLDEKIIFFGPTSKYYVAGDGPAPSGLNNDFTPAQKITGATGCTNQSSLLEIPAGLIYQDPTKGIYLLDRSLSERYIGAEVEAYNSFPVTSAQKIPNSTMLRLTLSSGNVLVYDWQLNQWGVDSYPNAAVDSCLYNNQFTIVNSAGLVLEETPATFTDNTAFIPLSLTTGWMSFAQVQGFQRVRYLLILGTYKSPHTLVVNIYNDYNETPTQTTSIVVGSDPAPYEFRIHIAQQKCTTMKIKITDSQSSSFGEGFSISALSFEVGVKKGPTSVPSGRSF